MSEETPAAAPVEETKAEDTAISAPINDAAEPAESEKAANLVQNKVCLGVSGGCYVLCWIKGGGFHLYPCKCAYCE